MPNSQKNEAYQHYGQNANPEANRKLGMSNAAGTGLAQAQAAQGQLLGQYQDMAAGKGPPSLAEQQMQAGMEQAQAAAAQQAASARGGNMAGMQQATAATTADLTNQAAQQGAMLRAQEQQMAMQGAAGISGQLAQQNLQAQMAAEQNLAQQYGQQLSADVDYRLGSRQQRGQERMNRFQMGMQGAQLGLNAAGSIVGGALGMSDERRKMGMVPAGPGASDAVGRLGAYEYEYEPGAGPPGRRYGVSAQEMERVAPETVVETPEGKMVDWRQGAGLSLAASADQERRLRDLEAVAGDVNRLSRQQEFGGPEHADPYFDRNMAELDARAQMEADRRVLAEREARGWKRTELGPNSLESHDPNYRWREKELEAEERDRRRMRLRDFASSLGAWGEADFRGEGA